MSRSVVETQSAPEAVGAYSQGVSAQGFVFCSGQVAIDPRSGEIVGDSVADQTHRCMENLSAVLEAAGTDLARTVKVTAYLADMGDFREFNEAYGGFFTADPPARATVGVAGLPKGARVEIECVALA
jgi:2-iminobutanoate/2-iminopropanoate deaminase